MFEFNGKKFGRFTDATDGGAIYIDVSAIFSFMQNKEDGKHQSTILVLSMINEVEGMFSNGLRIGPRVNVK